MIDNVEQAFQQFAPISLDEANTLANLQVREDNKYIIPMSMFREWLASLANSHYVMEINDQRLFTYDTCYFDTPSLKLFRNHLQVRRKRYKIRTRRYVESGIAFLEIKLKGNRGETIKQRVPHDPDHPGDIDATEAEFIEECLSDAYGQAAPMQLVPMIQTVYQRATLVARSGEERITCDVNLDFRGHGTPIAELRQDFVLVEIKTADGRGRSDRELWRKGIRPLGGSKYCVGVAMTMEPDRGHAFRRQIRRYFTHTDPSGIEASPPTESKPLFHHAGLSGRE